MRGERDLAGMTVNERMFELGVLAAYDSAKARGDSAEIRKLLERAKMDEPSIALILSRLPQPN